MSEFSGPVKRGAFILFEGIDRCGKTTQSGLLGEYCKSIGQAESIRFPDRKSSIGQLIDSYLQSTSDLNDKAIHLLFSANRWESSTGLEAKLNAGCTLVRLVLGRLSVNIMYYDIRFAIVMLTVVLPLPVLRD